MICAFSAEGPVRFRTLPMGVLLATAALISAPALAQTAPAGTGGLDEIVVTATKGDARSLQRVPISIQALTGDALVARGAIDFASYAGSVSSLQFQDLGPGDKKYIIRGVNSTGAATVGVYYDEAVITAANGNDGGGRNTDIRVFDLERIEVLKGPQGTLYGASSQSGTIRFITNKPNLSDFSGNITGEISGTEKGGANYLLHGTINAPLVKDVLGIRVTGWLDDKSGFIDQPRIPAGPVKNVNNDNTRGGRAIVKFVPFEDFSLTGSVTVQTTHSNGSSRYTPAGTQSFGNADAGFPPIPGGDLVNTDLTLSPWDEKLHVYSLTGEYKTHIGTFTATSNWFDRRIDFSFDSSPILFFFGVPVPAVTLEPQYRRIWSNELRYASNFSGPFNVVVGGFLQREKSDFEVQVVRSNAFGNPAGPFSRLNADDALQNPATGNSFFGRYDNQKINQEALFGEATFKVTDQLTVLGGIRYFHSTQSAVQETTHPFGGFSASPVGPLTNQSSNRKTVYKATVNYQATPDALFYFTFSQGFRVGGVNAADLPFTSNIPRGYNPDSLNNYEVGAKTEFLDHRLRANVTLFHIDYKNIQVQSVDATGAFPFITNGGQARINGVEADFEAKFDEHFDVTLGGSYQDAKLTADLPIIAGNPNQGANGDRLNNVPKFQGNAAATYRAPVGNGFEGTLRADLTYRGATKTRISSANAFNVPLGDYAQINLRASVDSDVWSAALFVRNVTNVRAQIDAINSSQDPLSFLTIRPRTWGASLSRRF